MKRRNRIFQQNKEDAREKRRSGLAARAAASAAGAVLLLCLSGCAALPFNFGTSEAQEGISSLQSGSYDDAAASFQGQIDEGKESESVWRGLGIALMGKGDYQGAAEAFEKALSMTNGLPGSMEYDINYYLGSCYFKMGNSAEALKVYDAILALKPNDRQARVLRGTVLISMGDYEKAGEDFRLAIDLSPGDYDLIIQIYETMERYGYREAGKSYLQEAMQKGGNSLSDYDRGRLFYYLEEYDSARVYLDRARAEDSYRVMVLLGMTYEKLGDMNYARNVYQSYLSTDQSHPEVYNQLGLCQMNMGEYDAALQSFERGLEIEDNEIRQSLKFNEIVALENLGEFRRAQVLMESYLSEYPGDEAARRESIFLETR